MPLRARAALLPLGVCLLLASARAQDVPPTKPAEPPPPAAAPPAEPPPADDKGKTAAKRVAEPPPKPAIDSITGSDAQRHIQFLAGPKCEGRGSGFEGCDVAGEYLIARLKEFGVEPLGENGTYKQVFQVTVNPFPGQSSSVEELKKKTADTFNVIGVVRGSDPKLKDEYVVLSAHYDHLGPRNKNKTFWGADDNASGTTALLLEAKAFSLPGVPRPRRSVVVLFCTGEERGLLGSAYFCDHPTVPLTQIVCDLNTDMVGRNKPKEIDCYGNATSPDLDSAHQEALKISGFTAFPRVGSIFLRSDQVNFYRRDIPCLFWTGGMHKEYHTAKDSPATIDFGKVARAATHAYATAWIIADRDERPRFQKMDKNASSGPLGAVLDKIPEDDLPAAAKLGAGEGAALVRSVLDGTAAQEAKLQTSDIIVGVGDDPLPDVDPVGAVETAIDKAKGGKVSLRVLRGAKLMKVTVKL
jgi:hypothetical protein